MPSRLGQKDWIQILRVQGNRLIPFEFFLNQIKNYCDCYVLRVQHIGFGGMRDSSKLEAGFEMREILMVGCGIKILPRGRKFAHFGRQDTG